MKLTYVIFYTNDLQRIKEFYREKVGLELSFGDDKFIAFKIGDALFGIKKATDAREIPGSQTIIISTPNVESFHSKLTEMGVALYKELTEEAWGRNFAILDPDGNKVEFTSE